MTAVKHGSPHSTNLKPFEKNEGDMTIRLYDLALADSDVRLSPYCWTVKFALLHKGLDFETHAVPFADKSLYPDPEYGRVPVLVHDGEMVKDSPVITAYLDEKFPDPPLIRSTDEADEVAQILDWQKSSLYPALAPILVPKILDFLPKADRDYFRTTREARFGKSLEEIRATPGAADKLRSVLQDLGARLGERKFFGGEASNLADYLVMGPLMWRRAISAGEPLNAPGRVIDWYERMLALFDGYAGDAPAASRA